MTRYDLALGKTPPVVAEQKIPEEDKHPVGYTVNCVICSSPATVWSGHVIAPFSLKSIIAGRCETHRNYEDSGVSIIGTGYYGLWYPQQGLVPDLSDIPWMTRWRRRRREAKLGCLQCGEFGAGCEHPVSGRGGCEKFVEIY